MPRRMPRAAALAAFIAATGCTQTSAPAPPAGPTPAASGVTAPGFRLPAGGGCAGEAARFRAVIDNDLATGHVARSVHRRIAGELDRADAACAAGRDAEGLAMLRATRGRFGYP